MTRAFRFAVDHYIVLPLGAAVALAWANLRPEPYFTFAHRLAFAVNQVGMAFFLALITKEVVEATAPGGALHTWRRVMLAVVAGCGGVAGAVLTYFAYLHLGDETSVLGRAWPIVCGTDIAFSYFIARGVCRQAAVPFLLLVAIVGNAAGLIVLELRYPIADVHPVAIVLVAVAIGTAALMRRCDVTDFWPYVLGSGVLAWLGLFLSGLHPALALVPIVPFLTHTSRSRGFLADAPSTARDALGRFQRTWKYPVQLVLFLFGLVNAGVIMRGAGTGTWAIAIAVLVGKPAGMLIALAVAVAGGLRLPPRTTWRDMVVVACGSSIGFTFALFFATAALPIGPVLTEVKLGSLLTIAAAATTMGLARLLRVGRFAALRIDVAELAWLGPEDFQLAGARRQLRRRQTIFADVTERRHTPIKPPLQC